MTSQTVGHRRRRREMMKIHRIGNRQQTLAPLLTLFAFSPVPLNVPSTFFLFFLLGG